MKIWNNNNIVVSQHRLDLFSKHSFPLAKINTHTYSEVFDVPSDSLSNLAERETHMQRSYNI